MRIAILGWGSLPWDDETERGREFNRHLEGRTWCRHGPSLKLEFSRISESRNRALTLVSVDGISSPQCRCQTR